MERQRKTEEPRRTKKTERKKRMRVEWPTSEDRTRRATRAEEAEESASHHDLKNQNLHLQICSRPL